MKKIRVYLGEKLSFGERGQVESMMEKVTGYFCNGSLQRFGLKMDAETFDDLIRGGAAAKKSYRDLVSAQLPVKSEIPYIAEKAQRDVDEAVSELVSYISGFSKVGECRAMSIMVYPDNFRFDEEMGKVVLTQKGIEAIENFEGYYMSNQRQVDVYKMAKKVVADIEALDEALKGTWYSAISSSGGMCILRENCGKISIEKESIMAIS